MKSNGLTTILNSALAVFLLLAVVFFIQTYFLRSEQRSGAGEVNGINLWYAQVQQLAADCQEYSKKNPAINPIVEPVFGKLPAAK